MKRAEQFIQKAINAPESVPKYVRLAIERHLNDLGNKDWGYYFSKEHASQAIDFIELNRYAEGELTGQPFVLLTWQAFIIYVTYGWRRKDNNGRRFVKAVIQVPRGNGKTELLSTIGNYGLLAEEERDPQIFWAATKKKQARIGFDRQKTMIERLRSEHNEVAEMVATSVHRIYERAGMGYVSYMGRDSNTEDGFSPYYALLDEMHAWKDNGIMHVLESGMVKRRNPMTWVITTEGYERDGPWDDLEKNCKLMLEGVIPQEGLFAVLFQPDESDDWTSEETWLKVNPSLGQSVQVESFRNRFNEAKAQGGQSETDFKVKNLNYKVRGGAGWIKDAHWQACGGAIDADSLNGRMCYGGVDLSSTMDFSSLCLMFPEQDGQHKFLWWFWLPEERFYQRARKFPVFHEWREKGYISVVPGNVIDYEYIRNVVKDACEDFEVSVIGCDPANAWQLIGNLQGDGVNIEQYAMTWMNMSEPTKQFERFIANSEIMHGDNPVARWMIHNVVIKTDANGNVRPHKGASAGNKNEGCIDGIIAAIIATGQYLTHKETETYSKSDIFFI